ncbi:hypothetical protein PsYK624_024760 [Phanerochaete sordida]|uniref:Uncharacterized protein n=1 Tax=Phanerochaete sordida TaxID=48140 RepID=A0A9P3L8R6_9APHY|nr:hypothetical protein PsYK624_024760 [Phanerochaete sordida]
MSPITFATRDEISDDEQAPEEDAYDAYTDDVDPLTDLSDPVFSDKYRYVPKPSTTTSPNKDIIPKANSASTYSDPSHYILLVFSTGQILEDHYTLEWYPTHPHELLELHPYPYLVKLPRASVEHYVKPYFEVYAWVLRLLDDFGSSTRAGDRLSKVPETADQDRDKLGKKRRLKIFQWQERWIIIREGHFQICKERHEPSPLHSIPLSSMVSLRGADYIKDIRKHSHDSFTTSRVGITEKHIICVKFRYEQRPADSSPWYRRGSRDATGGEEPRKVASTSTEEEDATAEEGDTVVFILLMRDEAAYDNLLRVLHRDSHSAPSSFFPASAARARSPQRPSYSPISFASVSPGDSPLSSPAASSPARSPSPAASKPTGVKYPEWRFDVVRKARRAGLGDVGRAMELAMFGNEIDGDDGQSEDEDRQTRRERRRGRQPNDKWNNLLGSDSDQESAEDSGSEREWEGWEADLSSQRKRRLSVPPDTAVQWKSGWQWENNGSPREKQTASMSVNLDDYEFPGPPAGHLGAALRANLAALDVPTPNRTLSSYASADSLLRKTLQSGSLRRPRRPESPSSYLTSLSRPRSPLAGELDDADYYGLEPGFSVPSPPQLTPDVAYPTRGSHETGFRPVTSTMQPGPRVPVSMTMTTITSTVTAGNDAGGKKGKGKGKARTLESPAAPLRKRSLTVQGTLSSRPSVADSLRDSPGTAAAAEGSDRPARSGKLKRLPKLSFAQVVASGPGSSSSTPRTLAPPPLSAASVSSFESPQFAHPDDSD